MKERFPGEHLFYLLFSDEPLSEELFIGAETEQYKEIKTKFIERRVKYKDDLLKIVALYDDWMERNLKMISPKRVTPSLRKCLGIPKTIPSNDQSSYFSCLWMYSAILECCNFGIYILSHVLDKCDEIYLSESLTKTQKAYEIEKQCFIYDALRVLFRKVFSKHLEGVNVSYKNKNQDILHSKEIYYELESLTFPGDLRAIRLFFEAGRLGVKDNGFSWGVVFCSEYIMTVLATAFGLTRYNIKTFTPSFKEIDAPPADIVLTECIKLLKVYVEEFDSVDIRKTNKSQLLIEKDKTLLSDLYIKNKSDEKTLFIKTSSKIVPVVDLLYSRLILAKDSNQIQGLDNSKISIHLDDLSEINRVLLKCFASISKATGEMSKYDINQININESHMKNLVDICVVWSKAVDSFDYSGDLKKLMNTTLEIKRRITGLEELPDVVQKKMEEIVSQMIANIKKSTTTQHKEFDKSIIDLLSSNSVINSFYLNGKLSDFIKTLSSAENLYDIYIKNCKPCCLDYSFIAILYYSSLENLINTCFYYPIRDKFQNQFVKEKEFSEYFKLSSFTYFTNGNKNHKLMNRSLELGKLANVFSYDFCGAIPTELDKFMKKELKIKFDLIKDFSKKINNVRIERNKAAHCTEIITYDIAKKSKANTYCFNDGAVKEYKGLIAEFIGLLGSLDE